MTQDFKAIAKHFWNEEYDMDWTHDEMVEALAKIFEKIAMQEIKDWSYIFNLGRNQFDFSGDPL